MNAQSMTRMRHRGSVDTSEGDKHAEDRLSCALEEFAAAIEAGEPLSKDELLARYSDVADELAGCLDSLDFIRQVAPQLADAAPADGQPAEGQADSGHDIHPLATLGDFRIIHELGRGGMGVVYEAVQLSLGRRVALKVLPFAAMLGDQQLKRFHNEARAAATLDHPNIVAVHSVGTERGVHYYAMHLVEGCTLGEIIAKRGRETGEKREERGAGSEGKEFSQLVTVDSAVQTANLAAETSPHAALSTVPDINSRDYYRSAARLGIQAAEALDHAHQQGIIHRDVKPANLLVDADGKLWVTDFGLARVEADAGMTMTGDLIGTLRYMSPEQALAKRVVVDHRTDIYSLGVTLYELLTGRPAFDESDRSGLLKQIAFDDPRPLRKVDPRIPAELETIVLKALEKSPEARYQTAQALADDLRAFLEHRPIRAKRPSIAWRARKWARRHRPLVASAAISAAVLVVVSLGVLGASNVAIMQERNEKEVALQDRTAALEQAEHDFGTALDVVDRLLARVGDEKLADVPQMGVLRAEIMHDAVEFYEKLLVEHPEDRRVRFETAAMKVLVAELANEQAEVLVAQSSAKEAIALLESLLREGTQDPGYREQLGAAFHALGLSFVATQDVGAVRVGLEEAVDKYTRAADLLRPLVQEYPENSDYLKRYAMALYDLWGIQYSNDKSPAVWTEMRPHVEQLRRIVRSPHSDAITRAKSLISIAYFEETLPLLDESISHFDEAIGICQLGLEEHPKSKVLRVLLADATEGKGWRYHKAGQLTEKAGNPKDHEKYLEEKEKYWREAIPMRKHLALDFPATEAVRYLPVAEWLTRLLVEKNRTDEAVALLETLWALVPVDSEVHGAKALAWRGRTRWLVKQFDEALADAQESVRLAPNDAENWRLLGNTYLSLGQFEKSVESQSEAIRLEPTASVHYWHRLYGYLGLKRYDEALADAEEAVRLAPHIAANWRNKGVVLTNMKRFAEAVESFGEAIRLEPHQSTDLLNRSVSYLLMEKHEEALADAEEAVRLAPRIADNWGNKGVVLFNMGRLDEAAGSFGEAIRLDPSDADLFRKRAMCYRELESYEKALADVQEWMRLAPEDPVSWREQAGLLMNMGRYESVVECCTQAMRIHPNDSSNFQNRAIAYHELGLFEEAVADAEKATLLAPENHSHWYVRGIISYNIKRYEEAVESLSEVIHLDPENTESLRFRAYSNWRLARYEEALVDLQQALRLAPENPIYQAGLAWQLATCPDDKIRDGRRAVELATKAYDQAEEGEKGKRMDNLAAAYAETGDFDVAIEWQLKAIDLLGEESDDAEDYARRLASYQAGRPWRHGGDE